MGLIHGDFDQYERNDVLKRFKANAFPILVATDVAGKLHLQYYSFLDLFYYPSRIYSLETTRSSSLLKLNDITFSNLKLE